MLQTYKELLFTKEIYQELDFRTSRSGGAGGQHVNKVETKVQLEFDISKSLVLTEDQISLVLSQINRKISKSGVLKMSCSATRSQIKNKEILLKRFEKLITDALKPVKKRKKTNIPKAVKKKRLADKKRRSEIKDNRKKPKGY